MRKNYVLDTSVLLQSPNAIYSFDDNCVILPHVVLEELDRMKKDPTENGANARQAAYFLDSLREQGDLTKGILLPEGGLLKVELNFRNIELPVGWPAEQANNRILKVCKGLQDLGEPTILVTKNIFERIKCSIMGIPVQDYQSEQVVSKDLQYKGRTIVFTSAEKLAHFYEAGVLDLVHVFSSQVPIEEGQTTLIRNEFVLLKCHDNPKQSALGRFDGERIVSLTYLNEQPFGIRPRNVGQRFALEALMMNPDEIPLVIIKGAAGTAKTFLSLAVGLHKIINQKEKQYRKILVCRPNVKLDEDIGFLPGSETEKLAPFMRSIIDNLEILVDHDESMRYKNERELKDKVEELFCRNIVTTEAIAYIRGRSIQQNWVIIDEAQNLTPKQVKSIVTRAGLGTKLVLIGDQDQIDHPYLDSRTNGLSFASERMKGSPFCCQITMNDDECERSPLAFDSAIRMKSY